MKTQLSKAVKTLIDNLNNDPSYREGWKANIAMAMYDEIRGEQAEWGTTPSLEDIGRLHAVCNRAANRFLDNLCYKTMGAKEVFAKAYKAAEQHIKENMGRFDGEDFALTKPDEDGQTTLNSNGRCS